MEGMRWLATIAVVGMGCTEHGKGGGDEWDVRQTQFAEAVCINACVDETVRDQCLVDVLMDMDQAREELPAELEAQCIECMRVTIEVTPEIVAAGCQNTPSINERLFAACGEFREACAGKP
jgi:hypothetical protein